MDELDAIRDLLATPDPTPDAIAGGRTRLEQAFTTAHPNTPTPRAPFTRQRTTPPDPADSIDRAAAAQARADAHATDAPDRASERVGGAGVRVGDVMGGGGFGHGGGLLRRAGRGPGRGFRRSAWWRPMRNGLVGAAAAAALAVAVAGPSGITISPDKRPSARQILLSAAGATAKAASTGAYWRTQVVTGQRFLAPDRRYVIQRESTREIWLSQEYGKDRWEGQYLGAKPASPQDESAWRDAGAPTSWQFPADVTGLGRISPQALVRADPGIPQHGVHRVGWRDADGLLTKRVVSWKALRQIPSDPAALRAAITKIIRKENGTYIAREMEAELRTGCLEVISALPVSPETRASAYQILASMPGMRAEGQVTDPLGRTGQALSYQVVKGGKLTDERIVIDPASGLPLAQETTGAARAADGRQVDVGYFVAYQQIGWTDQRPTP